MYGKNNRKNVFVTMKTGRMRMIVQFIQNNFKIAQKTIDTMAFTNYSLTIKVCLRRSGFDIMTKLPETSG